MKIIKELMSYVIIIAVVVLIRTFIITPVAVDGISMEPTLVNKQILLLKKFDKSYDRFDIVILKYDGSRLVKRIIGLPGEYIEYKKGILYVNGQEVEEPMIKNYKDNFKLQQLNFDKIPEGYYFVMGDNRNVSKDSRSIGLIPEKDILGVTDFSLFPFSRFGFLE